MEQEYSVQYATLRREYWTISATSLAANYNGISEAAAESQIQSRVWQQTK